jgi:hypothetical protein
MWGNRDNDCRMKTILFISAFWLTALAGEHDAFSQGLITGCEYDSLDCPVIPPPNNNLGVIGSVTGTDISLPCSTPSGALRSNCRMGGFLEDIRSV